MGSAAVLAGGLLAIGSCSDPLAQDCVNCNDAGVSHPDRGGIPAMPDADAMVDDGPAGPGSLADFTKGWIQVPWATQCPLYQPATPAMLQAVPPLQWTACVSGRSGCSQLVPDWTPGAHILAGESFWRAPGSTQAMFERDYAPYQIEYDVWDSTAGIIAAWRYNGAKECLGVLGNIATGAKTLTVAVRTSDKIVEYRQIIGTATELVAKAVPDYVFTPMQLGFPDSSVISEVTATSSIIAMPMGAILGMSVVDRSNGIVDTLRTPQPVVVDAYPVILGDSVFFGSSGSIGVWTRGAGSTSLVKRPAGTFVHDPATDGTKLFWIESGNPDASGFFQTSVVYQSPFAIKAADVMPTKLIDAHCKTGLCGAIASEGYFVSGIDPPAGRAALQIVRLSDGAHWTLVSAMYEVWSVPQIVGGELWFSVSLSNKLLLERMPLAALGAPDSD